MSNENPNNTPQWRQKLDELEHLPGSAFNRDAAWGKLYGRLRGNRKSKKIYWYWIAAACLLFGLMITLLNYHKGPAQSTNKETVMKQPGKIKNPVLKVEEVNKSENGNSAELIKDKIVATANKPIQRNRRIVNTEFLTKVHPDDVAISYPEKEPLAKPLQIININPTAAVRPQKKKLNVVHINELGDPVIGNPDVVHNTDIHSFRLKLASGEVFTNPAVVSGANSFTFLKTNPKSN
jgi:hypothetical protein